MLLPAARTNDFFDVMFNDPFFDDVMRPARANQLMKTDISEKDGNYVMDVEIPGYSKDDITADLKDGYLTVSAKKDDTKEEKDEDGKCVHKERYMGSCSRSFFVGNDLTEDDVKASYNDGVLSLTFPKEPKKIEEEEKKIAID